MEEGRVRRTPLPSLLLRSLPPASRLLPPAPPMRLIASVLLLASTASPALAAEEGAKPSLLDPHYGLMFWTLVIFAMLFLLLRKLAWGPILEAVNAREKALTDAMAAA